MTCTITDCNAPAHARGWCNKHYLRWWHRGDVNAEVQVRGNDWLRFWAKVDQPNPDACWEWQAACDKGAYGVSWFRGATRRAHLELGTPQQNDHDRLIRERSARGTANGGGTKLTEGAVRKIRAEVVAGRTHREVAAEYGVARKQVTSIMGGKTWGWVK